MRETTPAALESCIGKFSPFRTHNTRNAPVAARFRACGGLLILCVYCRRPMRARPCLPRIAALADHTVSCSTAMSDRDEVQVARWSAIKGRVGASLRELRLHQAGRSQARLAGELEELGYHVTQSMVSRYEQGLLDAPLTLERMVGWALCCESLSSTAFKDLLSL